MIDISIIIVCYKGWEKLERCLQALDSISGKNFSFEVIVSDNTPDPEEIDPLKEKFPRFVFFHNPVNGGFAYGSNSGALKASGKYLLFLNPDTVASEEAIEKLLAAAENDPLNKIISARQVNENGKEARVTGAFPGFRNLTGLLRAVFPRKKFHADPAGKLVFPDWVSGSVMLMGNDTFRALAGFDEDYWMYYEDVDICKRINDSGGRIALVTDAVIGHDHGGSSRINRFTAALTKTEVLISRHVYFSKHKRGAGRFIIQSFLVLNNLLTGMITGLAGLILFFSSHGSLRVLMFINLLRYYMDALSGSTWLSTRSINHWRSRK
jgi:GT2 family glycosyltransferase